MPIYASYEIDATVKYASINYPDNGKINRINQNNEIIVKGKTGNGKGNAKVQIKSDYGGVTLEK